MNENNDKLAAVYRNICGCIDGEPDNPNIYEDGFEILRSREAGDFDAAHSDNVVLREKIGAAIFRLSKTAAAPIETIKKLHTLFKRSLLFDATHNFDAYMQYIEFNRPPDKKFYLPRRHYLKPMIDGYQDILDGKLKLLTVSQPKRTGKSQTGLNFVNMISGKHPNRATLMEGAGDSLIKSFYNGCLEILQSPEEYLFYDVFPEARIVQTNADIKTINLVDKSRFPTIMCRSIDSTQVGLSEATNLLYLDDCVEGREEAHNRDRLDAKWDIIRGDVIGRAIEGTPIVATGTRYSLYDPIGHLQEEAVKLGWSWRSIEIPALDPVTDESNYEHMKDGKMIFTTPFLREQREFLSEEQWESEFQQSPFEAKGLVFPKKELKRFFKLPADISPDAIVCACDTAETGSDSCSMPVAYIYGTDVYIVDVVFDNSPSGVTKPQCAKLIVNHHVSTAMFESNAAGTYFARDVAELVEKNGGLTSIRTKMTISNKQTRIEFASDGIKKNFYFKDESTYDRNSQYAAFMKELTTHTRSGKVEHDDAADSLSLLENEIRKLPANKVEVFKRPC